MCYISSMALYRLVCAFGHQSLVTMLTRCGLLLPTYFGRREAQPQSDDKVYLPGRLCVAGIWHWLHHGVFAYPPISIFQLLICYARVPSVSESSMTTC